MRHSVRCDLNHCIGECQPKVRDAEQVAEQIANMGLMSQRDENRIQPIIEAYGKQEYDRGIEDAVKLLEEYHMFRFAEKVGWLKEKK